jgi:methylated-DNA-protein-cysteine methyltransferase-like protein
MEQPDFYSVVYSIVAQIPPGKVVTYGQIASLAGYPQRSRMVGHAMGCVPESMNLPCHRVVNSQGRLAPGWDEQYSLLTQEGVSFRKNGCVNLKESLWEMIGDESL